MALKANVKHHVLISTQLEFLTKLNEKRASNYGIEWKSLGKLVVPSFDAFLAQEEKDEQKVNKQNRYGEIECIDRNRIIITGTGLSYIHANYVKDFDKKKLFIGTQGPTQASVKNFWRMIVQEKSSLILMLCNVFEEAVKDGVKKMVEKSAKYWPSEVNSFFDFKEFEVHFQDAEENGGKTKPKSALIGIQRKLLFQKLANLL